MSYNFGSQQRRSSPRKGKLQRSSRYPWEGSNSPLRTMVTFRHSSQHCLTLDSSPQGPLLNGNLRQSTVHELIFPPSSSDPGATSVPSPSLALVPSRFGQQAGSLHNSATTVASGRRPNFCHTQLGHLTQHGGLGSWQIWNQRRKPVHWMGSWQEQRKDPATQFFLRQKQTNIKIHAKGLFYLKTTYFVRLRDSKLCPVPPGHCIHLVNSSLHETC